MELKELKIAGVLTAVQHVQYIQYNVNKETLYVLSILPCADFQASHL